MPFTLTPKIKKEPVFILPEVRCDNDDLISFFDNGETRGKGCRWI